ncbi:ABC transporter permease [Cohnella herbarum]|uniref:ABC transporter permease n=1 Tax=Cohnella herbarum TaxID=2728023 RepID=A0A7Z2ZKZ4_9BACL|nr:ABC transporter permease [Cohnella herbarum]QJD83528.1 ABC transporter permease [Cohnella herbarum]
MSSLIIANLNIRRTLGTRKGFLVLALLPILIISLIVGLFGNSSDDKVKVAVLNEDQAWLSDYVLVSIRSVDTYEVVLQDGKQGILEQLKQGVYDGKWGALVYIPSGFTDKLLRGEQTAVNLFRKNEQLWNSSLGITLTDATERLARNVQLAADSDPAPGQLDNVVRQLLEQQDKVKLAVTSEQLVPPNNNAYVLVIGLMLMFVMILVNQSIHGILEDRGNRTMARIFSAPVRAWEIALGNFLGCLLLGTLQLVLILAVTRYVLGFDFGVSFGKLLVIMEFFLLAAVGISSAAAAIVKNAAHLSSINNLVVIPTCMLGGCFWPVTMMPDFMQKLSHFMPQRWAIVALEQASSGASLQEIGLQLGILILFAAVLLAFGSYVLRPAES